MHRHEELTGSAITVLKALTAARGPRRARQLTEATALARYDTGRALRWLQRRDLIGHVRAGWWLTDLGKIAVEANGYVTGLTVQTDLLEGIDGG